MKTPILYLLGLFTTLSLQAQNGWCGFTNELDSMRQDSLRFARMDQNFTAGLSGFRAKNGSTHIPNPAPACTNCFSSGSGCPKATYVLPVVVHIVHMPGHSSIGTASNITDAQVTNAIERLNMAFRNEALAPFPAVNTGIQFCLAKVDDIGNPFNGIVRHSSTLSNFKDNQRSALFNLGQYYSAEKYINIYVVNQILDSSGSFVGKLGTATYPWTTSTNGLQGIVISHNFFGNYSELGTPLDTNSLGLVLPHEMGHYLGLFHPFDFPCVGTTDGTCSTQGDKCCDVPAVSGKNQDCTGSHNSCKGESYNGKDPYDQKENYMDYSHESCKNTFTEDQTSLMHFVLQEYRSNLWQAENVNNLQLSCCVLSAQFSGEDFMCNGSNDSTLLTAFYYSNTVTYKWQFLQGNVLKYSFNRSTNALCAKGIAPGVYTVSLTIDNGADTVTFTRINWFTVGDCSQKRQNTNSNWFFGNYAGVKFYQGGVFRDLNYYIKQGIDLNQVNPGEGTLSISDKAGRLLFYGGTYYNNGNPTRANFRVYDSTYSPMQGEPLKAWDNATTPAITFPMADSAKLYWVVTNTQDTLYQNIINMNITGTTRGAITLKNKVIVLPSWLASSSTDFMEGLTAVQHCNGQDHWVIAQVLKGTTSYLAVFNARKTGITYDSAYTINQIANQTNMKISPDGRWIAIEEEIFLFDRKTGHIKSYNSPKDGSDVLSVVFSPDSKKLYRYERHITTPYFYGIRQYDLTSGASDLGRSVVAENYDVLTLQTGPDSIIYVNSVDFPDYLFSINNPDSLNNTGGNVCGFTKNVVRLNSNGIGGTANIGLPQIVNALHPDTIRPDFTYSIKNCRNVRFIVNQCCLNNGVNWKFGDGSIASGLDTIRNYTSAGRYRVVMKWSPTDSVVHWINLQNDSADFRVFGDTLVCDTSKFNSYLTASFKNTIDYAWSFFGTSSNSQFGNSADAKWNNNGFVKLKITDKRTGCTDSSLINVRISNSLASNLIDSTQIVCDTSEIRLLHGSTPIGGNGIYSYQWYYRPLGLTQWRIQNGSTSDSNYPVKRDTTFEYYRLVSSNGCELASNVISVNTIKDFRNLETGGICGGKIFVKSRSIAGQMGYAIQWQKSMDSNQWTNISGENGDTLTVNKTTIRVWYRQKITNGNCTVYSPAISKGDLIFHSHPNDMIACEAIPFILKVKSESLVGSNLKFLWQYYDDNLVWQNMGGYNDDSLKNWVTWSNYRRFRVKVTSYCGTAFSNTAEVGKWAAPQIISIDSNKNITGGSPIKLKGQWTGERNVCYAVWQRSTNPIGASWDSIGKTSEDSFLFNAPNFNQCQQRWYYRIALRNYCPPTGKSYWNNQVVTSKVIELGSFQKANNYSDLWIPDSKADNGTEPNIIDIENYTHSHRLWNRNWSDKYQLVDDWTDRVDLQTDRDTNFIHLMVYNRGNQSVSSANIYFYWTVMSVNEDWPYSWTGKAKFINNDIGSAFYQDTFPLGGRINKAAIQLNSFLNQAPAITPHPAYNGQLQPGDSILITYPWVQADTVPQPGWYYGIVNNQKMYSNHIGLCLLARMQECDSPNFGMTYPEKIHYGNQSNGSLTYKGNIGYNILSNNNIVSSNYYLGYMDPPFTGTPQIWTLGSVKRPDSGMVGTRDLKFNFCVNDPIFYNHGEVVITPTDEFWSEFQNLNYPGSGFSINASDHQIIVHDPCADIGPIQVPDTFSTMLGFTWRYLPNSNHSGSLLNSLFTLKEYNESELIGITQYGVKSHLNSNGGNNGGGQGAPMPQIKDSTRSKSYNNNYKLQVHPNPFDNLIEITYEGEPEGAVRFWILDAQGRVVSDLGSYSLNENGHLKLLQNNLNSHPGLYYLKAVENNIHATVKMIKFE